ncbi:MAG: putative signal peptide peptidase SppA [Parcubacteria group bacterium ADurb.Bin192]|nr:MAG: putative signal peptide peptidase SppA [Parcubacteria group bacterium ADurb.Bin192]
MNEKDKKLLEFFDRQKARISGYLSSFFKKHHKKIVYSFDFVLIIVCIIAVVVAGNYTYHKIFDNQSSGDYSDLSSNSSSTDDASSSCSVLGLNLHGSVVTYIPDKYFDNTDSNKDIVASEKITHYIEEADKDENIKAILLEVDSNGGLPVAGEEIAHALRNTKKPSIAVIRQSGLSTAYWAASGATHIFASRNSDIGSIGVTASYLESVDKNKKDGYQYVQLSVGKYKDTGNPDKVLTDDEKALIMRDIKIVHQNFIEDVANYRNIPVSDVKKIADGSSVLGDKAKELKLIDEIGGLSDAKNYIESLIKEKPEICWQ